MYEVLLQRRIVLPAPSAPRKRLPKEHRIKGGLLIGCSLLLAPVEYRMYELLVIVIGHLCRKIVLLLLCSYAPLEDEKMYKRRRGIYI